MTRTRRFLAACLLMTLAASVVSAQIPGLTTVAEPAKIVHFRISGPMPERPTGESLSLSMQQPVSLHELTERMSKARFDDSVKAVVLTFESPSMGLAQLEELRKAIELFRAVDKDVYIHADALSTGLYALACSASHVSVVPTGDVWLTGLYAESPYLRGLLDKIGVLPEFIQMGDYKSAGETLTRTGPSEPAKEMMNWLYGGLYESLVDMIAQSRQMPVDKVKEIIDNGPYTAEEAKAVGLIDSVQHAEDFTADLQKRYGMSAKLVRDYGKKKGPSIDFSNPFSAFMGLLDEITKSSRESTGTAVAVVYVEGTIMTGSEQPSPFGGSAGAFSSTIRRALDKAEEDPSIKAVVLRVDSPGGSALASEIIWNATQRVKAKKPLVVSMGNVAGSGGYYVACGADRIFADATTITASIGVIGGKLVTTDMWGKLGITWYPHQYGANANLLNSAHPFTPKEREIITKYMEEIYGVFRNRVTEGRGDKLKKPIDELAGGRVFTGDQAKDLGLVDEIGTLSDAIKHAAAQASISEYDIRVLPEPKNIMDVLLEAFSGKSDDDGFRIDSGHAAPSLIGPATPLADLVLPVLRDLDPARAQALMTALSRLQLVHQERVILMMPVDFVIR
ncbi:MAG: signal peptide peptidase SppA [Phycisphaerae bacterium]|nr:signal peptide peptidase SppA [Phycisphaerae bacterium]